MSNLPQVCEELLRILPAEQLSHLRVLQAPGPHTRRHGQRLESRERDTLCERLLFGRITNVHVVLETRAAQEIWSSLSHIAGPASL